MTKTEDALSAADALLSVPDGSPVLPLVARVCELKAERARLEDENAFLRRRIAEEDARLAHA